MSDFRRFAHAFAVALALGVLSAPSGAHAQDCPLLPGAEALASQMLADVNAQRRRAGLHPLLPHATLDRAAAIVACDNARQNRMSHTTADGSTIGSRLRSLGYRFSAANENISMRRSGPRAAVESWMASPAHRTNILAPQMRNFGGAMVQSGSGQIYWVMVSAAPR